MYSWLKVLHSVEAIEQIAIFYTTKILTQAGQ